MPEGGLALGRGGDVIAALLEDGGEQNVILELGFFLGKLGSVRSLRPVRGLNINEHRYQDGCRPSLLSSMETITRSPLELAL